MLAFIPGLSYIAQLYGGKKQKEIDLLLGTEDGLKELRRFFSLFSSGALRMESESLMELDWDQNTNAET